MSLLVSCLIALSTTSDSLIEGLCEREGQEPTWGYKNIATLDVQSSVTLTDPAHICIEVEPDYEFRKFVNTFDANDPNGADTPQLQAGTLVTWTYWATNTGTVAVPFANISVTDSDPGRNASIQSGIAGQW